MDPLMKGRYNTADGHTVEIQYRLNEFWCGYVCEFPCPGQRSSPSKVESGRHPPRSSWLEPNAWGLGARCHR